jgi:hypothetical protein
VAFANGSRQPRIQVSLAIRSIATVIHLRLDLWLPVSISAVILCLR